MSLDHVVPLDKGGSNSVSNVVPTCQWCNTSKHNKDALTWFSQQPFYSEERWQFIQRTLGTNPPPRRIHRKPIGGTVKPIVWKACDELYSQGTPLDEITAELILQQISTELTPQQVFAPLVQWRHQTRKLALERAWLAVCLE
ncbi:MAG: HNH endonuclease [Desertifilum sp.]|nr:HNH endonuclease [Desertifilum sp.]